MLGIPHPYLTASLPGIGGKIKQTPRDFLVSEVPLYTPCGSGEHIYFEVEKEDLSTLEALERLARALGVGVREFGYAGLKDRKGVTRQTLSLAGVAPEKIETLQVPQITVRWVSRHTNKLRVGHLRGNRFQIRMRDVDPSGGERIEAILRVISDLGMPNYYGPQRFGNRGDAQRVGRSLLLGDDRGAVWRILGYPAGTEHNPHIIRARRLFMEGALDQALEAFPHTYREERRLLSYLLKAGENYSGARKRMGEVTRKLYYSAYQSYLFNITLAARIERSGGDLSAMFQDDLAFLHRNGAVFRVEDIDDANARAREFEISPSGPIFGMKMLAPGGVEGEIERGVLDREGVEAREFHKLMPRLRLDGGRRPLRVPVLDLRWNLEESELQLEFFLPKGCYATTLLRELMKCEEVPEPFYEDGEEEKHGLWRPPAPEAGKDPGWNGSSAPVPAEGEPERQG